VADYIQTGIGIDVYQDVIASLRIDLEFSQLSQPVCTMTSAFKFFLLHGEIYRGGQGASEGKCIRKDEEGNAVERLEENQST
jgi:hypothetical protein